MCVCKCGRLILNVYVRQRDGESGDHGELFEIAK